MDVEISIRNLYLPWNHSIHNSSECWWKGELYYINKLINIRELIDHIHINCRSLTPDIWDIISILRELNGSFSFILETTHFVLCVVDRIRSIPLFFSKHNNHLIISDDANYLKERINATFIAKYGSEFLATGYVTGSETLFEGIFQLQTGEFLIFDKKQENFSIHRYFHYLHGNYSSDSEELIIKRLDEVIVGVFNRLINATVHQGKPIVIPLSGGIDSRLIVMILKRLGVENVICFSYGKAGNYEANISKKVADTLGYPWYFVEYTTKIWNECYHSNEMRAYERYAGNLSSLPHIQDYVAVKILKDEGKIPENAAFVPGHTGDMISGGHIPINIEEIPYNLNSCINHLLQRHYSLWNWKAQKNKELEATFKERIGKSLGNIQIHDMESFANYIDFFNFNERQAKFIVNSVRIYEFFGYEWKIPLWDTEIIDFFLKVPLSMRLNQYIYKKYVNDITSKLNNKDLLQIPYTKERKSQKFKLFIKHFFKIMPYSYFLKIKILTLFKLKTEYFTHPLNWYSIMTKSEFKEFYSGYENINTYLSKEYIKNIL